MIIHVAQKNFWNYFQISKYQKFNIFEKSEILKSFEKFKTFQNPIYPPWRGKGPSTPTCCRISCNGNNRPLKTAISMCGIQAQRQKSATKSLARKNLGETSITPKFHMLVQVYLMCAHIIFCFKYLSGTYKLPENYSTGYPNFLEHFTTFWTFRNLRLLMCNFWYLGGKPVFQWFSGGPKSSMGIGRPACCQKGSFCNNRSPKTPISMCGHQAQISKFRKIL